MVLPFTQGHCLPFTATLTCLSLHYRHWAWRVVVSVNHKYVTPPYAYLDRIAIGYQAQILLSCYLAVLNWDCACSVIDSA